MCVFIDEFKFLLTSVVFFDCLLISSKGLNIGLKLKFKRPSFPNKYLFFE